MRGTSSSRWGVGLSSLWLLSASCPPSEWEDRAEVEPSFLAGVQASIAEREYRASETGTGLQAPNRRHNLRTYFGADGIRVVDRTAEGSPRLLELSLSGVGRGSQLRTVPSGTVHAEDARVEIRRPGLVEWFVNGPSGLEQGFTVEERPAGEGALVLELELHGATAEPRGNDLVFATHTGRALSYGKLAAWDARGQALAAELKATKTGRVAFEIDDGSAEYPIAIDPLLTAIGNSLVEADQIDAGLGVSVASAGDVNADGYADLIVGAVQYDHGEADEGAAFVFLGSPNGVANAGAESAQAQLESDQAGANMGNGVASAGDVNGDGYADVIVGAPRYGAGQLNEGAAFVFLGGPTGVVDGNPITAHAQLESDQVNAFLGARVASAGDVNGDGYGDVIVGATSYSSGQDYEGAAFVFLGGASGIADGNPATAHAQLESDQLDGHMGSSVASAGDVNGDGYGDVIVGAWDYSGVGGASDVLEGAAFVFLGSASGIADGNPATAHARLESNQNSAHMGTSVASAGDVNGDGYGDVIVRAYTYDAGQTDEGAAFVFLGSASGIPNGNPATAHARLESNQAGAFLGWSVASAGDVNGDGYADVIIGAHRYGGDGAAFVYLGSATGIRNGSPITAYAFLDASTPNSAQGVSVASAGDVNGDGYADVVVGASGFSNPQSGEGAAFIYHGGATGLADYATAANAATRLESNLASAELGCSVASAGDVNGDGYSDVIVGARLFDAGETDEGAAFVFHGGPNGVNDAIPASASTQLESNQANAQLGASVASAGDVNGDGYGDVIVGANQYDAPESDEGAAFVFLGSASGVAHGNPANAHARLESNQANARLGVSVASAGDVNGDGYADVIAGAWSYDAGQTDEGAAFVFLGSASGVANGNPGSAHARLESDQANAFLGWSVASAGDVNGDGYADVIAGAWNYGAGQAGEGAAFVFLGSASGLANGNPGNAHAQLESDQASAQLGFSVASAGDVNGDGYADVIVGAPDYDSSLNAEGAAFVFLGGASGVADGIPVNANGRLTGGQAVANLGYSVASAGDVNGDGYSDVIVGAPLFDNGQINEGGVFVFLGREAGIYDGDISNADGWLESDQAGAVAGESVASAGDVNGDGFADVIFGARSYDSGQTNEGAAFVFEGSRSSGGRAVVARQRRGDGSGIAVQPWGSAGSGAFVAELLATHPAGTGRVKAEYQACPAGVPFGGASCRSAVTPSWIAVNGAVPSLALPQSLTSLASNTLYRWRGRILHAPSGVTAAGIVPPPKPAHGPWRRLFAGAVSADIRTGAASDLDGDGISDAADNCPTIANATQADADVDQVGDVCDSCTAVANPRVAAGFLAANSWATLTGGQRDDDHDGYGNKCDAKFSGTGLVGASDLTQFRASNGKSRANDNCGTSGSRPCAIFDLDENAALIGAADLTAFRSLNGKLPGPKCPTCPLICEAGATGTCF